MRSKFFLPLLNKIIKNVNKAETYLDTHTLPGLQGKSILSVGRIYLKGLQNGDLVDRAAAVSFNLFTTLFPFLLFTFSIIPYIPIANFQEQIISMLIEFLPPAIWDILKDTIYYIVDKKHGSILSISIIITLYLGSNGINCLLRAFTKTPSRTLQSGFVPLKPFQRRLISIFYILYIGFLVILSIVIFGGSTRLINYISVHHGISKFLRILISIGSQLIPILILLIAISTLYRAVIKQRKGFPFFSIGGIITTILLLLTTKLFQIYIDNFTHYNILYGSLGTILILTFYIYLNSLFLLTGFDLNASIYAAAEIRAKSQ